ncbi:MAG: hypothetical protein AAB368_14515 [bacterium]
MAEHYAKDTFAIWTLYDRGDHLSQGKGMVPEPVQSRADTVEHALAGMFEKPTLILTGDSGPAADLLRKRGRVKLNGNDSVLEMTVADQADAVFFFPEASLPRPGAR